MTNFKSDSHWATCVVPHPLSLRGPDFFFAETSTSFRFVLPAVPSSVAQCSPAIMTVSSAHRAGATARSPWSPGRTASTAGVISFNILPLSDSHLTDIRYQSCLAAGMRPSWILSEEERARRFKTFFFSNCVTQPQLYTLDKMSSTIFCCL